MDSQHPFLTSSLLILSFALTGCGASDMPAADDTAAENKVAYERDYGIIRGDANRNGLGGVITDPVGDQEQICFENGLCINVITTLDPVHMESAGSLGCNKVKRMANTIRQIAFQLKQVLPKGDPLPFKINDLGVKGDELGNAMKDLELCAMADDCDLQAAVDKLHQGERASLLKEFHALKTEVDTGLGPVADVVNQHMPEAPPLLDFQTVEITRIVEGVKTGLDTKTQKTILQFNASYTQPQTAKELCRQLGKKEASCTIRLPAT